MRTMERLSLTSRMACVHAVRACIHRHAYTYCLACITHTYTHTHTRTHTKHARVYAPYTRASPRARTHTNTHMHAHSHIHAVAPGICVHARVHTHTLVHTHTHTVTCRHIRPYIRHAFPPCNYIHTQTCLHDTHACLEGRRARVCARQGCTLACKQGKRKLATNGGGFHFITSHGASVDSGAPNVVEW